VSIEEVLNELKDIRDQTESMLDVESEMEILLKEIIKIERQHLYGLESTSVSKRRNVIQELLIEKLKNKKG